jgi:hypothetical protein
VKKPGRFAVSALAGIREVDGIASVINVMA